MRLSDATFDLLDFLPGEPYIVGGAVRDMARGVPPHDVDIEVHGVSTDEVLEALRAHDITADLVGVSFGVIKARHKGEDFDISLPRTERKTGPRHTDFEITVDPALGIEAALSRRDFTINSMAYDRELNLIDPFGGMDDLRAGVIRHTSDAFSEDPLRALRAARFAARFGFKIAPETIRLCRSLMPQSAHLARERVAAELRGLFEAPHPVQGVRALELTGWWITIPGFDDIDVWALGAAVRKGLPLVCRLAAAFRQVSEPSDTVRAFGLDNGTERQVVNLILTDPDIAATQTVRQLARFLDVIGLDIDTWASTWLAIDSYDPLVLQYRSFARANSLLHKPFPLPLSGEDLIAAGLTPGPIFATILHGLQNEVDAGNISNRATALVWLKQVYGLEPK